MTVPFDKAAFRQLHRELRARPAPLPTCSVLGIDLMLFAVATWLATGTSLLSWCLATLLFTLVLLHFYLIHHECVHRAVFLNDRFNVRLGQLLGVVLVYPFRARRCSHLLHHVWAGHLARDPTNARAGERLRSLSPRALRLLDVLWHGWIPFLAINERIGLVRGVLFSARERRTERWLIYLSFAVYGLGLALVTRFGSAGGLAFSYGAAFWLLLMLEELINLPHHLSAPTVSSQLPLWQQTTVTHSCKSLPLWSRWVLLNFNLHSAHHVFPSLPWCRLPDAEHALSHATSLSPSVHELSFSVRMRRERFATVFAAYLPTSGPNSASSAPSAGAPAPTDPSRADC